MVSLISLNWIFVWSHITTFNVWNSKKNKYLLNRLTISGKGTLDLAYTTARNLISKLDREQNTSLRKDLQGISDKISGESLLLQTIA